MKKYSLLFVFMLCILSVSIVFGNDESESGSDLDDSLSAAEVSESGSSENSDASTAKSDEKASEESKSKTSEAKEEKAEKDKKEEENNGLAKLPNGKGYVGVYSYLNLRDGVWGNITGSLYNNEEVTITGRDGDWYKVSTSKGDGYAHARYIFDAPDKRYSGNEVLESDNPNGGSSGGTVSAPDVILNVDGDSLQGKVVNAAKQLVDKYGTRLAFPYDPLTTGSQLGSLGCAQVATTALVAAGALDAKASSKGLPYASLNCTGTISMLEAKGWSSVSWPPYQAGDVVFWETYQPGPSHVGIVMNSGNSAQAMNNSSSGQCPRYSDITSMKICKIMRKI